MNEINFYRSKGDQFYIAKNYEKSLSNYLKYLKKNKNDFEVLFKVARIYKIKQNYELSIDFYNKCLKFFPGNKNILINLSNIYLDLNKPDESIKSLNQINLDKEKDFDVYFNFGLSYQKVLDFKKAIKYYDLALKINKDFQSAFINKCLCLSQMGEKKTAINLYNEGLKIYPNNIEYLTNLSSNYADIEEYDKALNLYDQILAINPNHDMALNNKGNLLTTIKKYNEAEKCFNKAISISPEKKSYKLNRGYSYLSASNYYNGFNDYENRISTIDKDLEKKIKKIPTLDLAILNKQDNVFVWSEQGIGDQVLFSKFLIDLSKSCNVILQIDERLKPLIKRMNLNIKFIDDLQIDYSIISYQISIASLAKLYVKNYEDLISRKSRTFPVNIELKKNILKKINFPKNKIICGISWQTSVKNIRHKQSLNLLEFFKQVSHEKFYFVNLQYGDVSSEIRNLEDHGFSILNVKDIDNFNDIESLVSLMDLCDCVITVSNSNAHISGSIGKKTYLLLPYDYYWYWQSDDENKNLWYKDVKIIKKQTPKEKWQKIFLNLEKTIVKDFKK